MLKAQMEMVDIMQDKQVTAVERHTLRKNKIEMLEMKSTVAEIKNTFNGLTSNLNTAKERISELEAQPTKITQIETQREFRRISKII